jgi:D-alanyl-lipoteichoic acid acyltransferase DltB (MBOAT superfamily)
MYRNIFLTMLLGGLWHGANWTFVVWGAIHGVGLAAERFIKTQWHSWRTARRRLSTVGAAAITETLPPSPAANFMGAAIGWLITFHLFTLSAIFFRSPHIDVAFDYFTTMFSFNGGAELLTPFVLALTVGSVAVQFLPGNKIERFAEKSRDWSALTLGLMLGFGLLAIEMIGPEGVAPFIYFQF